MLAATTHSKLCNGVYPKLPWRKLEGRELPLGGGVLVVRLHLVYLALGKEDARVSVYEAHGWEGVGEGTLPPSHYPAYWVSRLGLTQPALQTRNVKPREMNDSQRCLWS